MKLMLLASLDTKSRRLTRNLQLTINIPGYHEFLFQPTETTHGGTGFYLKDHIDYVERNDLDFNSVGDFESSLIEIKFPKKKNLVIGCIYIYTQ